jgi:hypothetical protein
MYVYMARPFLAANMAMSSVSVVANSLLLSRYKLSFAVVRGEKNSGRYMQKSSQRRKKKKNYGLQSLLSHFAKL